MKNIKDSVKKARNHVSNLLESRNARAKEILLSFGAQDSMDILSYSGLEEHPDYLTVDGQYMRTICVAGFPLSAYIGWLDGLINFDGDIDVALHVAPVDASTAIPKLTRKITEFISQERALERDGKIVGSEVTDPLESAISMKDDILRGQGKLFHVSIYATLSAESKQALDKKSRLLETMLSAHLFISKDAYWQQLEGLQSVLPRGENQLDQKRDLDSPSAAVTFPFTSSELVHPDGILYGVNLSNKSLVILDRYSLNNSNSIIFAQSGSGKSYTAKVEIKRQLQQGVKVIVIDPEREYARLTKSVDGTYIKLSANSKERINPLEFLASGQDDASFSDYIQTITEIIALMVDDITSLEKSALDKALVKLHESGDGKQPILGDLYTELKKLKQDSLCKRLDKYVTGSLKGVFNSPTNIELENRLVVFDIKDMPDTLRPVMMTIVSNFVQNQVMQMPQEGQERQKRLLVIDEGWLLLRHEQGAQFVTDLVRRARKYDLAVTIISQQANDFLKSEYGEVIASQSSLRILMRQDVTTIEGVARHFKLSAYEQNFLLTCNRGEALIIDDQNHVAVRVVASEEEHRLITTNPGEIHAFAAES